MPIEPFMMRRFQVYLRPRIYRIAIAFCYLKHKSKSKLTEEIIEEWIEKKLSQHQQNELLEYYRKMTANEKRRPNKLRDE